MHVRSWRRVFIALVSLYALLVLVVALAQRRLLYVPTRFAESVGIEAARREGLEPWRNTKGNLIGWQLRAPDSAMGSMMIVHGNAGSAVDRMYMAGPAGAAAALNVFILEYPGYGAREGVPTLHTILDAAEEAFRMLPTNGPVYLVGESLGTGAAAHLAKAFADRVAGMVLFVPYNKLASVAQAQMPWLPASFILRDRFDPAGWLKDYRGKILFVVAGNDTIIPPKFGQRLHDGYAGPKRLQLVPNAGHNDVAAQSIEWWRETFVFLRGDLK